MRIKLPRPLHGWPELAWQVSIIVIGVLIALAAEQLVDDWSWRRKIQAQRSALDENVSGMWEAMSARVMVQGCVDRRLKELALVLERQERGLPLGIVAPIGRPAVWTGSQAALRMATADGSFSHMRLDDKQPYFDVANSYDTFAPSAAEERASWRVLQSLNQADRLDAVDWREIRGAYRDAVDSNRIMKSNLVAGRPGTWLAAFTKFRRYPDNKDALTLPTVQELCRPAVKP
jgi:hypothetical protein